MIGRVVVLGTLLLAQSVSTEAQSGKPPAKSTSRTPQRDAAEAVFANTASKIVFLLTRKSGELHSRASGVILSADGYIGTNYHALQGADAVEIRFFPDPGDSDDYQSFNRVKLLYTDRDTDIAVLKVNAGSLPFLECPANTGCEARVGERVYAIGNPKGLSNTISEGIVSALRSVDGEDVVQHTAPLSPGSSGGALVDASGVLVGMNSWQVTDAQNLNFAISAKHLLAALASARHTTAAVSFPPAAQEDATIDANVGYIDCGSLRVQGIPLWSGEPGSAISEMNCGEKVHVLARDREWDKVQTETGNVGYVKQEDVSPTPSSGKWRDTRRQ